MCHQSMIIARPAFLILTFALISCLAQSQEEGSLDYGSVSGVIETLGQYYIEDSTINAVVPDEIFGLNSSAYFVYKYKDFSAGLRYESYMNALQGYPTTFEGSGIGYRFINWKKDEFDITAGNLYEQFGSGMIMRIFEERSLGLDNALDGVRVKYSNSRGLELKGVIGRQRRSFNNGLQNGDGLIRGVDLEMDIMSLLRIADSTDFNLRLGGSFVSKYNDENLIDSLILPKNVGAGAIRLSMDYNRWRFSSEYMTKANDPYPSDTDPFDYLYKNGEGMLVNLGYSTRGFAVDVTAKHSDNIVWRSTNVQTGPTELLIGYVPALNKQHTYNLASTLYPYNTNLFGENSYAGTVLYKVPKKSILGGKYGMDLSVNIVQNFAPKRDLITGPDTGRDHYSTGLFATSDSLFAQDINIGVKKKFSKKVKGIFTYINFIFDDRVVLVADKHELIYADIVVADITWKIRPKKTVRIEAQHLWTEQDQGNWVFGQVEYTISPHWSFTILDQYNYGNSVEAKKVHYALGNVVYSKGTDRVSLQYGKQRAGFFCVGGICRAVPASNSLSVSFISSF